MKTKITLTIIGALQVLQAILYSAFAKPAIEMMFNIGEEATQLALMFQYAISPAFLMIGLMLLFSRNTGVENAKKLLLAIIIAYIPLFIAFYCMSVSPMTNMGIGDFAVDIVMFGLAVYTYFKPKN
jgi:ABC-type spermidine/putrescine transport system permease subunit II|tara:strand:+ start:319 stop:696 length:378 start_codon:yes stop_codon:yes gene_type:complete